MYDEQGLPGRKGRGATILRTMLNMPAGFLLVLWGWAQGLNFFRFFLVRSFMFSFTTVKILEYLTNGLILCVFLYTVYYLWMHKQWHSQIIFKNVLTVWIGWFLSMVLTNLMLNNVMHTVVFELQHAIFMLLTAIAFLITGKLIDSPWMYRGGILMVVLAFAASYVSLKYQMGLEALGWFVAFAFAGHKMHSFNQQKA